MVIVMLPSWGVDGGLGRVRAVVVLVVVDFIKVGDGGCRAWMVMVVVMMEGFDGGAAGLTMVQWQCYNDDWG